MRELDEKEFEKAWNDSDKLDCPKLRGFSFGWIYNKDDDPCESGDCNFPSCHNYKRKFDEPDKLWVKKRQEAIVKENAGKGLG